MNDNQSTLDATTYNHINSGLASGFSSDNTYAHIPNTTAARFDNTYSHLPQNSGKPDDDLNDSMYNHLNETVTSTQNDSISLQNNQNCNENRNPVDVCEDNTYNHLGDAVSRSSNGRISDSTYNVIDLKFNQNDKKKTSTSPYNYAAVNKRPHLKTTESHSEDRPHEYFVLESTNDAVDKSMLNYCAGVDKGVQNVTNTFSPEDRPHEYFVL